jgi:hypothetical protein
MKRNISKTRNFFFSNLSLLTLKKQLVEKTEKSVKRENSTLDV